MAKAIDDMIVIFIEHVDYYYQQGFKYSWSSSATRTFPSTEMKVKIIALALMSSLKVRGTIDW